MRSQREGFNPTRLVQLMPPLITGNKELSIDFWPLFVARKLIMDVRSFEILTERSSQLPIRPKEQLSVLHQEGFIELQDYNSLKEEEKTLIKLACDTELGSDSGWDELLIPNIDQWLRSGGKLSTQLGKELAASGQIPYVLNEYMSRSDQFDNQEYAISLWNKIKDGRVAADPDCLKALGEMLAILLDYANTHILLASKFNSANYVVKFSMDS
jgi:hypothetical protein